MRVKRWLTPPSSRPPERSVPPRAPPRSPPPLPLSRLSSPPPSIISARQYALRTTLWGPTPRKDPQDSLYKVLQRLPPISQTPRTSLRSREQLERELAVWRRACAVAHAALSGPLKPLQYKFRNSVVRVVGHTMRLLLRLNHVGAAKELDRAFFTTKRTASKGVEDKGREEGEEDGKATKWDRSNGYAVGNGLGLERGELRIAWMQSLAVRLEGTRLEEENQAKELGDLLFEMRRVYRGRGLNPLILAFIVRKLEVIHSQLDAGGGGKAKKAAKRQLRQILESIKQAETDGQKVVSLALLDGAISKLEKQVSRKVDRALYGQVEREMERLIGTLDGPLDPEVQVLTELHQRIPDPESIDRHSHILYLAIRFLLFRARHTASSPSSPRNSASTASYPPRNTLSSASQLYTLLLDLSPAVATSPFDLSKLRQRQSSALFRLLWAHLGVLDTRNSSLEHLDNEASSSSPVDDHTLSLITAGYDLIDLTLQSTSALPPPDRSTHLPPSLPYDPRLVGVSTRFHRHALYLLSLSSAPSRRAVDSPFPPWSIFQRAFKIIDQQRTNDSKCLRPETRLESRAEWEQDLIVHPALAIHLLRATLLGSGNPTGSIPTRTTEREGSPMTRLGELVEMITKLETAGGGKRKMERKARKLFKKAVNVVVEDEWKGEGARMWKDLIKSKIETWADEQPNHD
ncbi:uncharacterized protein JCM6883_001180 [Sporobolomyces salmoneus]|uniref:uncharacterized protein n=1 Tax=Sporobolomyces salmoneus TaxID=183962 RepID=UPI00316BB5C8